MVGGVEGGAEHDDPAARGDRPHDGMQGGVDVAETVDVPDAGGVEQDGGGPLGRTGQGEAGAVEAEVGLAGRDMEQVAFEGRVLW